VLFDGGRARRRVTQVQARGADPSERSKKRARVRARVSEPRKNRGCRGATLRCSWRSTFGGDEYLVRVRWKICWSYCSRRTQSKVPHLRRSFSQAKSKEFDRSGAPRTESQLRPRQSAVAFLLLPCGGGTRRMSASDGGRHLHPKQVGLARRGANAFVRHGR